MGGRAEGTRRALDWRVGGVLLGLLAALAVAVQGPLGVSTAYVTTEAVVADTVSPGAGEGNAYWKSVGAHLTPEWVAVLGIVLGGVGAAALSRSRQKGSSLPETFRARYGARVGLRYLFTFAGGFLILFGARLASGCTSGHVISGMSQLAISGMVFAAAIFASGIPVALAVYRRRP